MWLSLFVLIFFLAAAYWQAIQGLTSAVIMGVLTIICLAASFGTYEYVAQNLLMDLIPEYAYAAALLGTFIIPLGILRTLLDMWVPRSSLFPQLLDQIGGGAVGLVASFITTGMLALAIQMVPWGRDGFLGFQRFDPAKPAEQNELWLKPDRAAASFGAALSAGVFSGSRPFAADHADLVTELGWVNSAPRGVRLSVPANVITVQKANRVEFVYDSSAEAADKTAKLTPVEPTNRDSDVFIRVLLQVGDKDQDADNRQRYTLPQIRLVGEQGGAMRSYPAVAVVDPDNPTKHVRNVELGKERKTPAGAMVLAAATNRQIDVVFECPNESRFKPQWVAYKLGGRASLGTIAKQAPIPAPDPKAPSSPDQPSDAKPPRPGPDASKSSSGGRVSGVRFASSSFSAGLPLTMSNYSGDSELEGSALVQGEVFGLEAEQGKGGGRSFSSFKVPGGKALLQLNVENVRAGSTLGHALAFSVKSLENYLVTDDSGKEYAPVGKYAIAEVGGEWVIELQYNAEFAESGARGVKPFTKISDSHLKGDYQLVYLYLIDPGRKVVKFSTGRQSVDLAGLNLVAR